MDRAWRQGEPIARLHPVVEPSAMANALTWKLGLRVHDVRGLFTPAARIAFVEGDDRAVVARLHRRGVTTTPAAAAGRWHVLLVRWPPASAAPHTGT